LPIGRRRWGQIKNPTADKQWWNGFSLIVQRKENGLEAGETRMKAIVMRQTKTLPLITLIERIFADRAKKGEWTGSGCDKDEGDCDEANQNPTADKQWWNGFSLIVQKKGEWTGSGWDKDEGDCDEANQNFTADNADRTDFYWSESGWYKRRRTCWKTSARRPKKTVVDKTGFRRNEPVGQTKT
jgi:hypothetical protein